MKKIEHINHKIKVRDLDGNIIYFDCGLDHNCDKWCNADNCPIQHEEAGWIPL